MVQKNTDSIGYAIGKTNWYLKNYINKLLKEAEVGVTSEQWLVLKEISGIPGLSQTEIAEKCMKDKTNITRILDLLEKNAYVERRKDSADRRVYRIFVTEKGKKVIDEVLPVTLKADEVCKQSINSSEEKTLIKLLDAVCSGIKEEL